MEKINQIFVISSSIILLGYILKRIRLLTKDDGQILVKLVMNVTLPALIITVFSSLELSLKLILLPLINIIFALLALLLGRYLFKKDLRANKGSLIISLLGFNIGLFAYPFVETIWGKLGLKYIAIFDMGNAFIIFGLTYIVSSFYAPNSKKLLLKEILIILMKFVPLMSYVLAISLNLLHLRLSGIPLQILQRLAVMNGPLVLLILGLYLEFSLDKLELKNIIKSISIKYILGLIVGGSLYFLLPYSKLFKGVILLGLIMPAGMAIIPYSIENKLNTKITGSIVNISNIISFILMWLIFKWI
ncbi:AEC family transporter [Iocasia frigidifontis]|uniref:AEC family transporter n=1 Tax=Iocasia fonsfrigidae TaxID=2682810 RepID=A0A8A7KI69_9FIRM|nr:AEC family transporter [Iocasia fonsfrigidae]QTL99765.1 AEC family transporter [Iocasia fonsfrigidae]